MRCRPSATVVADKQTAIDDTVVTVSIGSGTARRIPVDEAAWETFLHLISADPSDRE